MFNMLDADNKIGKGNLALLVDLLKALGKTTLAQEAEDVSKGEETRGPSCTIDDVISCLKDMYVKEYANVRPLPWCEDLNLPLGEVYTNLQYQRRDGRGYFEDTSTIVSLKDIYKTNKAEASNTNEMPAVRRIRVEGDPGIGKSCSCQKLAHDSSDGKLDVFKAVFFLDIRHMSGKVKDAIFEQLLPEDTNMTPDQLWSYIQENQDDVLFILDGLDELSQTARERTDVVALIQGKILRNCHVLVTSRPYHCVKDLEKCHEFYKIVGYSRENSVAFIQKYFSKTPESARRLAGQLKDNGHLSTIVVNPLNNVLICIVWEDNEGKLPSSPAELYQIIVYSVARRYCAKKDIPLDGDKIPTKIEEALLGLGKLSWEGLEQDQLQFNIGDVREHYGMCADDMLTIGLLTRDRSFSRIKRTCFCTFLHKTFQEYMAAYYVSELVKKESKQKEGMECLRSLFGMTVATATDVDEGLLSANRKRYEVVRNMFFSVLGDSSDKLFEMFAEELNKDGCEEKDKDVLSFICIMLLGRTSNEMRNKMAEIVAPFLSEHITNDVRKHCAYGEIGDHAVWFNGLKQVISCQKEIDMSHNPRLIRRLTIFCDHLLEWSLDNMFAELTELQSLQHVNIDIDANHNHSEADFSQYDSTMAGMVIRQSCLRSFTVKIAQWCCASNETKGFGNLSTTLQSISHHTTLEIAELEHPVNTDVSSMVNDGRNRLVTYDVEAMLHKLTECVTRNKCLKRLRLSWKIGKQYGLFNFFQGRLESRYGRKVTSKTIYKGICSRQSLSDLCVAIQGNRTLETLTIDGMFSESEGHQEIIDQLMRNKPENFKELRITMSDSQQCARYISAESLSYICDSNSSSEEGGTTVFDSEQYTQSTSTDTPSCGTDSISHELEERHINPSTSTGVSGHRYDLQPRRSSGHDDLGKRSRRSQLSTSATTQKKAKAV
ncbi:uncharacterized protein [Branchiostoma lanceolatum]|uniref:uncharacterized protein n=1 Tax=Branchiostoma lanceolatum TaxID=7740 RepID=UPI0034561E51